MKPEKEIIEQLFRCFAEASKADEMAEDIAWADRVFEQHPPARLSDAARAALKNQVRLELMTKHKHRREIQWGSVAAAVLLAVILTGLYSLYSEDTRHLRSKVSPTIARSQAVWPENFAGQDTFFIELEQELDTVMETLTEMGENAYERHDSFNRTLDELEQLENYAVAADFWKG